MEKTLATEKICQEGLKYVAGYVAWRFSYNTSLGVHTRLLSEAEKPTGDWILHVTKGHLKYPSEKLLKAAQIMNEEFERYHGRTFAKDEKIFDTLATKTNENLSEKLDMKVLLCLVRTRTYIRLRQLNGHLFAERKKLREQNRMRKNTNIKR